MNKEQMFDTKKYECQKCHQVYLTTKEYFYYDGMCDSCYNKYLDEQMKKETNK